MITGKIPRFAYGPGWATIFQPPISSPPWRYGTKGIGGSAVATSGVAEAFLQRRDLIIHIPIRFREVEMPSLFAMIAAVADAGGQIQWFPDYIDNPGANQTGYLVSPSIDEEFVPTRGDYPGTLSAEIVLRLPYPTNGPAVQYYATPAV